MRKISVSALFVLLFAIFAGSTCLAAGKTAAAKNNNVKKEETMQSVYEFIKSCNTYYLATVENGQPRVRPFGTINIFNGKLYIQTGKSKNVSKQLAANPKAELCCFDGKRWLRLAGELVNDDSIEAKKSMLDSYPNLRGMYNENDGNTQVLYFKNATATFSSFTEEPKTVKF